MKNILTIFTLMMAGRVMTIAYIGDVGSEAHGAAPIAWLMPLIGDAVIGLSAFYVAYLLWFHEGPCTWMKAVIWNFLGLWDALSAFTIHMTNPWPEFFMIQTFGSSMFFMATVLHIVMLVILYSSTSFYPNLLKEEKSIG